MNDLKHLKRLSTVKSKAGIRLLTPAVSHCSHCPMHVAVAMAGQMKGLSSLLIGTQECSIYSPKMSETPSDLHWMYVLDEHEVVFGCRDGLMAALRKMDAAGAKAILLIATCIPELIGEDIEGIIHEIQPELTARLTCVLIGHFKCISAPSGYWKTALALGHLMEPMETSAYTVNVLCRTEADSAAMPLLPSLRQKGFQLRFASMNTSLEDILSATDAALNLVVSPGMQPLADMMERKFGIRHVGLHHLFGVEDIDKAYGDIARKLGVSFDGEFEDDRKKALDFERKAMERLGGLRYIISYSFYFLPIPLAVYLAGFGMEPLLLHMEEFYPEDRKHAKELVAAGHNPLICHMTFRDAGIPLLESLHPELCFGYLPEGTSNFPCVANMNDICGHIGYTRAIELWHKVFEVLDSSLFSKKAASMGGM